MSYLTRWTTHGDIEYAARYCDIDARSRQMLRERFPGGEFASNVLSYLERVDPRAADELAAHLESWTSSLPSRRARQGRVEAEI